MQFEVEQKFPVADSRAIAERLEALGASLGAPGRQEDRYYAHPVRQFAETDEALRIRRCGVKNVVTYKGPRVDRTTKTRRELELPIAPGEAGAADFAELLEALGFRPVAEVRKSRRTAVIERGSRSIEIACDDVEGLGRFIELETSAEQSDLPEAQAAITALAGELGLQGAEPRSYLELLQSIGKAGA